MNSKLIVFIIREHGGCAGEDKDNERVILIKRGIFRKYYNIIMCSLL